MLQNSEEGHIENLTIAEFKKMNQNLYTRLLYLYFLLYVLVNFTLSLAIPYSKDNECINFRILFYGALISLIMDIMTRAITKQYLRRNYRVVFLPNP